MGMQQMTFARMLGRENGKEAHGMSLARYKNVCHLLGNEKKSDMCFNAIPQYLSMCMF